MSGIPPKAPSDGDLLATSHVADAGDAIHIMLDDGSEHQADSAISVDKVLSGGPAQRAGLQPGDRIVAVDAAPTPDVDSLHRLLGGDHVGRRVRMDLLRGVRRMALDLVPDLVPTADRPALAESRARR